MRSLEKEFENKVVDYNKLIEYGFKKRENIYIYKVKIYKEQFEMTVYISEKEKISKLIDLENEDEYILVDISDSEGEFVGSVRKEYEAKIKDIINKCTTLDVFKFDQSKQVIKYIKQKYNDNLEFLWEKFDNNAIWRNKKNNKWYGLLLTISEDKLKINSNKIVEIIDLRYQKDKINEIIDNKKIYPGYHMNKKSWITIKMDGSLNIEMIYELIDNSYILSLNKK